VHVGERVQKNKLYPSVTTADAGSPSLTDTLNDTWKKIVQAVSPDNGARQPDSENAARDLALKIPRRRHTRRPALTGRVNLFALSNRRPGSSSKQI